MNKSLSEILTEISEIKMTKDRSAALSKAVSKNQALRKLLLLAYDETLIFNVPKTVDYRPCLFPDQQTRLYQEMKRMYLFIGQSRLDEKKRRLLWTQFLEGIDPKDAELMIAVRSKRIPYKNFSRRFVEESCPGLIPDRKANPPVDK